MSDGTHISTLPAELKRLRRLNACISEAWVGSFRSGATDSYHSITATSRTRPAVNRSMNLPYGIAFSPFAT